MYIRVTRKHWILAIMSCAWIISFTPSTIPPNTRKGDSRRERAGSSRKQRERQRGGREGKTRTGEKGGGKALFRQPDNLPSLEHIYGCPLTPSSCSLWRQSAWCWPACRFPIISHAERSCLPIHQQVWTQTLMAIHQPLPNSTQLWSPGSFIRIHNALITSTRQIQKSGMSHPCRIDPSAYYTNKRRLTF